MKPDEQKRFYSSLGERLQRARRRQGLTQEELAARIDFTRTSVVNIEKGRQKVLCHTLVDLLRELRVAADELLPSPSEKTKLETLLRATPLSEQRFVRSVVASSERQKR